MKRIGRVIVLCLLAMGILLSSGTAERVIPDVLRATQEIDIRRTDTFQVITTTVLHTAREDVNEAITARVAALTEEAEPLVPRGKDFMHNPARADICTQITRTGDRWMSFHICAAVSYNSAQLWVKSEEYTYDMETGRMIRLGEIISEEGWETLIREIRSQAEIFFPEDEPVANELDEMCRREKLEEAGFVVTPGHLALYFSAAAVYPAHAEALLRVEIYVPELREILTEEARQETDCTGYDLVAMTYDDGPAKGTSRDVLNMSACHPGQVTFFVIGKRLVQNAEIVHKEFDAGHSVQSHTWQHSDESQDVKPQNVVKWETKYNQTMGSMIGALPVMMRPPGGNWKMYEKAGNEMPMILWSANSQDVVVEPDGRVEPLLYFDRAMGAKDGDIMLFHDVKIFAGRLAGMCMERFEERNTLLVTVNDLCALRGVPLEPGAVLKSCPREEAENAEDGNP